MKKLELAGQTFNRLTVVSCGGPDSHGAIRWVCKCSCGNIVSIRGSDLKRHFVKSCGCLNTEVTTKRNKTHGHSHTRLYRVWQAMRDRTANPRASRYLYYGGRGYQYAKNGCTLKHSKNGHS